MVTKEQLIIIVYKFFESYNDISDLTLLEEICEEVLGEKVTDEVFNKAINMLNNTPI